MIRFDLRDEKTKEDKLTALVIQAIGAGSMCWSAVENAGTFRSGEALEVAHALIDALKKHGLTNVK